MKYIKKFESKYEINNGEYFIYHATTSSMDYFLARMNIVKNNMVVIDTLYKTENGNVVPDVRSEPLRWNDTIENFLKTTLSDGRIKFHSYDLQKCKDELEILADSKKFNL